MTHLMRWDTLHMTSHQPCNSKGGDIVSIFRAIISCPTLPTQECAASIYFDGNKSSKW